MTYEKPIIERVRALANEARDLASATWDVSVLEFKDSDGGDVETWRTEKRALELDEPQLAIRAHLALYELMIRLEQRDAEGRKR